jgi:hypothetical protein
MPASRSARVHSRELSSANHRLHFFPASLSGPRQNYGRHLRLWIMSSDEIEGDFVSVHSAPNATEHLLLRSLLEGRGIEVRLEMTNATGTYPDSAGSMANSDLFVPVKDAERAREILKAAEDGKLELKADPELGTKG